MLGKLMKYELRAMGRILLPLYLLIVVAVTGLSFSIRQNDLAEAAGKSPVIVLLVLFAILCAASVLVMIVMTLVLILQRFHRNLLGNEGYLMFSLPVSTAQHILSKSLSALLWILASFLLGGICAFLMASILGYLPDMIQSAKAFWNTLLTANTKSALVRDALLLLGLILVSILRQVMQVYAAIALGHQWTNHRVAGSFLAYLGLAVLEGFALSPLRRLMGELPEEVISQSAGVQIELSVPAAAGGWTLLISFLLAVLYGVLTWYLLNRHLNLE